MPERGVGGTLRDVVGAMKGALPGETVLREQSAEYEPMPIERDVLRKFGWFLAHVRKIECIIGGEVKLQDGCPRLLRVTKPACTDMPLASVGIGDPIPWQSFSLPERLFVRTCLDVGFGTVLVTIIAGQIKSWEVAEQTVLFGGS
jgi:hypothetical protein